MKARRAGLGPEVEKERPAGDIRIVVPGDRLDPLDVTRREHQRLGAVVLDATAQILDFEPIA